MAIILFGDIGLTALVATECSTFVHINSGTSRRSKANPDGDPQAPSVERGNALAAHSSLLLLIIHLLSMTFLLEQPGSSVLMETCRMQWLIETINSLGWKVYKQAFWMAVFGHPNPKRTVLWSNNVAVRVFTTPKVAFTQKGPPTVDRYVSKKTGRVGYKGSKHLKATEHLDLEIFFLCEVQIFEIDLYIYII